MSYDESVIEDYQALQQETIERQNALNDILDETQVAKTALETQKATLDQQLAEAEALVKEIQSNQEEYAALMEQLAEEDAALNEQIAEAEAEYAEQIRQQQEAAQAGQNGGSSGGSGGVSGGGNSASGISLAWPCGSRTITSYFGYRSSSSTNGVGSTNHMGIDIGGVGYRCV